MVKFNIKIETVLDAKKLVNICSSFDFDVDILAGKYVIDAKSIMGLFSLDLSKPVVLHADCDNDHEFVSEIQDFIVSIID